MKTPLRDKHSGCIMCNIPQIKYRFTLLGKNVCDECVYIFENLSGRPRNAMKERILDKMRKHEKSTKGN